MIGALLTGWGAGVVVFYWGIVIACCSKRIGPFEDGAWWKALVCAVLWPVLLVIGVIVFIVVGLTAAYEVMDASFEWLARVMKK